MWRHHTYLKSTFTRLGWAGLGGRCAGSKELGGGTSSRPRIRPSWVPRVGSPHRTGHLGPSLPHSPLSRHNHHSISDIESSYSCTQPSHCNPTPLQLSAPPFQFPILVRVLYCALFVCIHWKPPLSPPHWQGCLAMCRAVIR